MATDQRMAVLLVAHGIGRLVEWTPLGSAIVWQNAPVGEVGVTGDQPETLLPVIIERMKAISVGHEDQWTDAAIALCERAQQSLANRRAAREAAKVEGTHRPIPA